MSNKCEILDCKKESNMKIKLVGIGKIWVCMEHLKIFGDEK